MRRAPDDWSIREPDFTAQVVEADGLELWLAGTADDAARARLASLIERLHVRARAVDARAVVVDLRQLERMGPGAMGDLATWLARVRALPAERRYRLRFRANPHLSWQRSCLRALACFATDLVAVEP